MESKTKKLEKYLNNVLTKNKKNGICRIEVSLPTSEKDYNDFHINIYFFKPLRRFEEEHLLNEAWFYVYNATGKVSGLFTNYDSQCDEYVNLQESIRRILREIEEDRVQIRLGRNAERHFGTVQNIIISLDGEDITSEDNVPGLGKMNIVIKDGEIIVGDIFIPEKYRRKGIATVVYQKISDYFGLPIVSSTIKGFNQTKEGGYIWKNRDNFKPRNLQESIRRILREDVSNPINLILRRLYVVDEYISDLDPEDVCRYWRDDESKEYVNESMAEITRSITDFSINISDDEYGEKFDEIYGILIDLGYREKFKDFFYESLQNCNPKHRMRFMKPQHLQ
jgi:hypothetical protein